VAFGEGRGWISKPQNSSVRDKSERLEQGVGYVQDNEVISASEMLSAESRVAIGRARPVYAVSPSWTGCVLWSAAGSEVSQRGKRRGGQEPSGWCWMSVLAGMCLSYVNTGGVYAVVDLTMSRALLVPRGWVQSFWEVLASITKDAPCAVAGTLVKAVSGNTR
jgi:hypothetical protein